MIAIIDYGAGNLFSVKNALDFLQKESTITEDVQEIRKADASSGSRSISGCHAHVE